MITNINLFADSQLTLWDDEPRILLANKASARTLYGSLCERIASEALGLRRLKISGNFDACYDAQGDAGKLFEVKSVKRSGACPIWIWRMNKDKDVAAAGHDVSYAFVTHNFSGAESSEQLWHGLSKTVKEIFVVPLGVMAELHKDAPFGGMKLGLGGSGYDREGYRDGYRRVSVKTLRQRCGRRRRAEFAVAGHGFEVEILSPI